MAKKTKQRPIPLVSTCLAEMTLARPGLWAACESLHIKGKKDRPAWSYLTAYECCEAQFLACNSMAESLALLRKAIAPGNSLNFALLFLSAWSASRAIYRFDPALIKELAQTPLLTGPLPFETLTRLPHRAVYVEAPDLCDGQGLTYEGFGAVMEWFGSDAGTPCEPYLDLNFFGRDAAGKQFIHATGLRMSGESLDVVVDRTMADNGISVAAAAGFKRLYGKALSMLLWLCQDEPDISRFNGMPPPLPTQRIRGRTVPIGDPVRLWDVGLRVGRLLAASSTAGGQKNEHQGGTHARPRPHLRRAHWHLYWTGERGSVPKVLFVHPCLVNAASPEILPAVLLKAA